MQPSHSWKWLCSASAAEPQDRPIEGEGQSRPCLPVVEQLDDRIMLSVTPVLVSAPSQSTGDNAVLIGLLKDGAAVLGSESSLLKIEQSVDKYTPGSIFLKIDEAATNAFLKITDVGAQFGKIEDVNGAFLKITDALINGAETAIKFDDFLIKLDSFLKIDSTALKIDEAFLKIDEQFLKIDQVLYKESQGLLNGTLTLDQLQQDVGFADGSVRVIDDLASSLGGDLQQKILPAVQSVTTAIDKFQTDVVSFLKQGSTGGITAATFVGGVTVQTTDDVVS